MKDDLRYTPSDCFETFPFPERYESLDSLTTAGERYFEFRAELMQRRQLGLTDTYNAFHDRYASSPDILELRRLHDAMDRAVLDAYGWTDLQPTCEPVLAYDDGDEDAGDDEPSSKKQPWRWRWPDAFRDEVLARLLALNRQRAAESAVASPEVVPPPSKRKASSTAKKRASKRDASDQLPFDDPSRR